MLKREQVAKVKSYGVFLEAAYASLYLGSACLAPLAVLHYVLVGERKGFRPHPLFDPVKFRMNAGAGVKSDESR